MKERTDKIRPEDIDRHLDTPSEANRDKHINFLDEESGVEGTNMPRTDLDEETKERQRQWREGIAAGKQARDESL